MVSSKFLPEKEHKERIPRRCFKNKMEKEKARRNERYILLINPPLNKYAKKTKKYMIYVGAIRNDEILF